jgi:hypothetical protein
MRWRIGSVLQLERRWLKDERFSVMDRDRRGRRRFRVVHVPLHVGMTCKEIEEIFTYPVDTPSVALAHGDEGAQPQSSTRYA